VILAEDESHLNLLPWLRSTWIARGERHEVMKPGKNQKRTIFRAIDPGSLASPDAGNRIPLQHALAAAGLRTEPVETCFSA